MDVDEDGTITNRDGVMIARYLLGVRGASLVAGQSGPNTVETVEENIRTGLETWQLDVNNDKKIDGNDGIIIARYFLGVRGEALLRGTDGPPTTEQNVRALQEAGAGAP